MGRDRKCSPIINVIDFLYLRKMEGGRRSNSNKDPITTHITQPKRKKLSSIQHQ